jgi:hypothetical protein
VNPIRDPGDFSVTGRRNMPENQFAFAAFNVDAVQSQRMEVRVKIQGIAETLNEGDGAAAGPAVRGGNPRPAANRGKHSAHEDLQHVSDQGRVVGKAIAQGKGDRQHRTGTSGKTRATRCAAVSAMRRPQHDGQKRLHLRE